MVRKAHSQARKNARDGHANANMSSPAGGTTRFKKKFITFCKECNTNEESFIKLVTHVNKWHKVTSMKIGYPVSIVLMHIHLENKLKVMKCMHILKLI